MSALACYLWKLLSRGGAAVLVLLAPGCQWLQNDWADLKEAGSSTTRLLNPDQGAVSSQGAQVEKNLSRE